MSFIFQNKKIFLQGMEVPLKVKIAKKYLISNDAYIYRCEVPDNLYLGVPVG